MHIIKHFLTITKHRHKVMWYCFKSGLYYQGLCHDLSKYSIKEFWNGAKYFAGDHSPNENERQEKGYSEAWMHHKGRNKHHPEYWIDIDPFTKEYKSVPMPKRYIAESVCDRIAASKIYYKKNFTRETVLNYFLKEGSHIPMHEQTRRTLEKLLRLYVANGEKFIFKYLKKNMRK